MLPPIARQGTLFGSRQARTISLPVGQALEVCCLADLLLAIPGTRLRPSLAVHALSSEVGANYRNVVNAGCKCRGWCPACRGLVPPLGQLRLPFVFATSKIAARPQVGCESGPNIWIRDATGRHAEPFATDLRLSLPQPTRPDATHPRRRRFSWDIFGDEPVARVSNGITPAVDAFLSHKRGAKR